MSAAPHHLFLFDVDSVLVEALGYLRALQDTVAHFTKQLGAGSHAPTEAEARAFEAYGLTSEWDSGAACVGLVLVERLLQDQDLALPPSQTTPLSGSRPADVLMHIRRPTGRSAPILRIGSPRTGARTDSAPRCPVS